MNLTIRLTTPLARFPDRSEEGLIYDIHAICISPSSHIIKRMVPPHSSILVRTGLIFSGPRDCVPLILSRTVPALNGLWVASAPLVVDLRSDDELEIPIHNGTPFGRYIQHGMAIASLMMFQALPFAIMEVQ